MTDRNDISALTPALRRCRWCGSDPLYVAYHDTEWGRPVEDDRTLFEYLVLESAQAGLSWITILRRREGYRRAFLGFDFRAVAAMTGADEEHLMADPGIVRHRGKIHATIVNARLFGEIVDSFGSFHNYVLGFMPGGRRIVNHMEPDVLPPSASPGSEAMSRDMRRRGFRFFGPTVCYAFLQAAGYVNDHEITCPCHPANSAVRAATGV